MTQGGKERIEEGKEESIHQGDHEKELEAIVPTPEARALHSQVTLGEAIRHLDLPTASIGKNEAPGIIVGVDGFIGEQIPEGASRARA